MMYPDTLKCEYQINPLGVENKNPQFSWTLRSSKNGARQKGYQLMVASSLSLLEQNRMDMWDSGEILSDESINISYQGKELISMKRYWWKVKVKDECGIWSTWSPVAFFEMGLDNQDWKARWIGYPRKDPNMLPDVPEPAPLFRKVFSTKKNIRNARIYISGVGYYKLYLNGKRIGDAELTPAVSLYDKTVFYDIHDVTDSIAKTNVLSVVLGNGWYNSFTDDVWNFKQSPWRDFPKMILQLSLDYEDNDHEDIISDTSWKCSAGPIVFDGLRNGEHYDARLEIKDWNIPGFDDSLWKQAKITRSPGGVLRASQLPPIKITREIAPMTVSQVKEHVYLFDIGQNLSGWVSLHLKDTKAGEEVVLKYGEKLNEQGDLYTADIDYLIKSGEFQTDRYITKGALSEQWEPSFTYHGFRYVQLSGYSGVVDLHTVCCKVVHTAFGRKGSFIASDDILNKIQQMAHWSTLTNYHGIPTDCPHREKNGWTGDALLSSEQMLFNYDPITAYRKWMRDFIDSQRSNGQIPGIIPSSSWGYNWGSGPAWDSAIVLIPWYMYLYSGDKEVLGMMYEPMKRYVDFMSTMEIEDGIVDYGLGDWCSPSRPPDQPKCPTVLTDTAYYYVDNRTFSNVSEVLGKECEHKEYSIKAERIKQAFKKRFFDESSGKITSDCQTAYACALFQGIIEHEDCKPVFKHLLNEVEAQDYHIDTGILGSKYILHTLSRFGKTDIAYRMVVQEDFPGWGNLVKRKATTLWEYWDGRKSQNHHMFSDVSSWFYRSLAGINPDPKNPGFKHVVFIPGLQSGLKWVDAWHESPYGVISSRWEVDGDSYRLEVSVPANCSGEVVLPSALKGKITVIDSNETPCSGEEHWKITKGAVYIDSGKYVLTGSMKQGSLI